MEPPLELIEVEQGTSVTSRQTVLDAAIDFTGGVTGQTVKQLLICLGMWNNTPNFFLSF